MQKAGIIPYIKVNKPAIAYANACFLPSNYTTHGNVTDIHTERREKREITLAVVALISVLVGALVTSVIQYQLKSYNDILNDKLEKMENKFTKQLNQIENQIAKLQEQEWKLANTLANLARITAILAKPTKTVWKSHDTIQPTTNGTTNNHNSKINRGQKIDMSENARQTQREIEQ